MAKKINKKNYAKFLPKAGSTAAIAMAMTVALATQVNASEIDELNTQPIETPPVDVTTEANVAVVSDTIEPAAANEAIEQANSEVVVENTEAVVENTDVMVENTETVESNEVITDGALEAPDLSEPVAPETPSTEGVTSEEYNEAVGDYNESVDEYNQAVDGYNETVEDYNTAADAYDQAAQEQYEEDKAAYEEAKTEHEAAEKQYEEDKQAHDEASKEYEDYLVEQEKYEEDLKQYEEDLTKYEEEKQVHDEASKEYEDYLKDQAKYEEDLKQYEEDLTKYEGEKQIHDGNTAAYNKYLSDLEQYNTDKATYDADMIQYEKDLAKYQDDVVKYNAYVSAKDTYDAAYKTYQGLVEQYKIDYAKYETDSQAYADYQLALKNYNDAKDAYDKVVNAYNEENKIYIDVTDYNTQVENKNEDIETKNEALENALHAEAVADISQVSTINQNVAVDAEIMETLKGYTDLNNQKLELDKAAAALEAHAGKDQALGTDAYAEYLAAVEAFNLQVSDFNAAADKYNAAVEKYNDAVNTYNETKDQNTTPESSTDVGTEENAEDIDWGNVEFDTYGDLTHIDVKYNAAASQDVTIETDADGKEIGKSYSEAVNQYTVTGVFKDKETADQELNKEEPSYGLSYSNDDWKTSDDQALKKDAQYDEFGNTSWDHTGESLDPVTGDIRFYVTLTDSNGKQHGITINMDATSVYADGSYYKAEANDFLANYEGKDGKKLKTETINGVEYYNVSGESVFLISALTCDGMTEGGYYEGFGWNRKFVSDGTLHAHGLDLILNMQTMIEIHQSANANTISYVGYEKGKTAQAEAPTEPEEFTQQKPSEVSKPSKPTEPTFQMDEPSPVDKPTQPTEPTEPTQPTEVPNPGEGPTKPTEPTAPTEVPNPGEGPTKPTEPTAPTEVPNPGEGPADPGTFDRTEPTAPEATGRLNTLEKLEQLAEKIIVTIVPTNPDPTPVDPSPEYPVVTLEGDFPVGGYELENDGNLINIPDEEVPLAKAPKTGDLSGLWAALSFLSLGGIGLLNKKRKED